MLQVLHNITMRGGEQVELLATPALFGIARRRGWKIEADSDNASEVFSAFTKLIYLAALNAWEVRRYDDASLGDCPYRLMDFVEWASGSPQEYTKTVDFVLVALTGKDLKDYATEGAKLSENAGKTAKTEEEGEGVKKKSSSTWITRLFRRFS